MGWQRPLAVPVLLTVFLLIFACPLTSPASLEKKPETGDKLTVSGVIEDAQGNGVQEVEIELLLNGRKVPALGQDERLGSDGQGAFVGRYRLPQGALPDAPIRIRAVKPGWQAQESEALKVLKAGTDAAGDRLFQVEANLTLKRQLTVGFWIAGLVLLMVYLAISFEWMHRTLVSFLGAALIIFITHTLGNWDRSFYIISFDDAVGAIDLNVIFLLLGMMLFMGVMKKTGMFQYLAYKAYAWARGNIFILSFALQVITAVISAFLNNITTMILVLPVTIGIAVTLKINPLTLLIPEVFASNIGGAATLIGDPPNILIGSHAGLTFGQFVQNLTLVSLVALMASSCYFLWWYKKDYLKADVKDVPRTIEFLKKEYQITDKKLMTLGLLLLGFAILFFILGGILHLPVAVPALVGSLLLLAISGEDIVEMLEKEVEWPTLLFFMRPFHGHCRGGGDRADPGDGQLPQGCLERQPDCGHDHHPLGVGHRLGLHRQHPLHRHHAAHHRLPEPDHPRGGKRRALVGPGPGGLSGGQRHHGRGFGQHGRPWAWRNRRATASPLWSI